MKRLETALANAPDLGGQSSKAVKETPYLGFNPHTYSKRVCVIGAGVSGLRAAGLLAAAGLEVTILEARDRIGGRVQQTSELGLPVDVGASWIHGTLGNPFVALAQNVGAVTLGCSALSSICDSNGNWLGRGLARRYYEEVWEIIRLAMSESREHSASISDSVKMMDFFRDVVERRRSQVEQPETYESLMLNTVEMWGAFMGDECERQSLKNLWLDAGLEGDNLFVASTFKDVLADLSIPAVKNATLRLGCEVTRIANLQEGAVDVWTSDTHQGSFMNVIVTAPLGWLKRNGDVFSPPLEPKIHQAIHSLGYGNLDKVFIKFPRAFWNDGVAHSTGFHGPNMDETETPLFPLESLFLSPEYAPDSNPEKWRTEIISFSGLPEPFSQPVIMFFVYGQWGRHITGLVRGMEQVSEEYYRVLDANFQPLYSKLPHYEPTAADCKPLKYLSTDWQNDKLAGYGGFTNLPVGSGDCAEHFEALRDGMGEDRGIGFAGEHVSPLGGLGTVTGAYWSGELVARKVAHLYGIEIDL